MNTMTRQLAKILADSISPDGVRLTTMVVEMPRIVLAEANTHRVWSRNSASSRAIPIEVMLRRVIESPYIPEEWGQNGKGMQAHGDLSPRRAKWALRGWLFARSAAVFGARFLLRVGVHKQTTNRLLEPFLWHTVIVTATEWSNFFHLRCSPMAHPAIRNTAEAMREVYENSTPTLVPVGGMHLPLVDERDEALTDAEKVAVSVARCARVSYLTHEGKRDPAKDIELHDQLLANGHMSPFEHVARPLDIEDVRSKYDRDPAVTQYDHTLIDVREHFSGNFRGWVQYRKEIPGEADILGRAKAAS